MCKLRVGVVECGKRRWRCVLKDLNLILKMWEAVKVLNSLCCILSLDFPATKSRVFYFTCHLSLLKSHQEQGVLVRKVLQHAPCCSEDVSLAEPWESSETNMFLGLTMVSSSPWTDTYPGVMCCVLYHKVTHRYWPGSETWRSWGEGQWLFRESFHNRKHHNCIFFQ